MEAGSPKKLMVSSSGLSKNLKDKIWICLGSLFYLSVCVIFLLFSIGHRYFLRSRKTFLVKRRRLGKDHLWNILCLISSCIRSMACSLYSSRSSAPSFDFSIDQGESWRVTSSCRGFETRNLHEGVKSPPRGEVLDDVSVRKFSFLHRHVLLQPVDNSFLKLRHLLLLLLSETAQSKSTYEPSDDIW